MWALHILGTEPEDYFEGRDCEDESCIKGKERANDHESESMFNPSINLQKKIIH